MVEGGRRRRIGRLSTVLGVIAVCGWTIATLVRFILYGSGERPVLAIGFALVGAVLVFFITTWIVQGVAWFARRRGE